MSKDNSNRTPDDSTKTTTKKTSRSRRKTMKEQNEPKTESLKTPLTLAECLENILENNMTPELAETEYETVCSRMGINRKQALLFSAILELSVGGEATPENLAHKLGCSNLHFISLRKEIDGLIDRRFVRSSSQGFRGLSYRVSDESIKCIQNDQVPASEDITGLSSLGILRKMNGFFHGFWRDSIDRGTLYRELCDIIAFNGDNAFIKSLTESGFRALEEDEQILLLYMIVRRGTFNEDQWGWEDFGRLFCEGASEDDIRFGLETGTLELIRYNFAELVNNDGIVDNSHICFTDKAQNSLLSFFGDCNSRDDMSGANLIHFSSISERPLFYNSEEDKQVATLTSLLQQENYEKVVERLKEKHFRSGVAVLFHGQAGTGKTESVYQIARQTGRDIFLVDVSQLKSKWVGDSEKNVRSLFQQYRTLVKKSDKVPILLFNEADAIFGVRRKGAEAAVDKMENAVQNIILQEMENLEGILIATTNLTQNFDPAFERRFIYKVKFSRPTKEVRAKIWETMVDGMDESTAASLAGEFDFSGGQIENISRKMAVDYILSGEQPELDEIRQMCAQETLDGKKKTAKIGF